MRLEVLDAGALLIPSRWLGGVLCHDVPGLGRRPVLLKGHRLERADALALEAAALPRLHVAWLEPGDVDEDTAALRLARAVAGEGVEVRRPVESQVRLVAARRGILSVDAAALAGVNAVEGCTVFALLDGMPLDAGRSVAGAKVTPLAIAETALGRAEAAARTSRGVLRVLGLRPLRVTALLRDRLTEAERERFETTLTTKVGWFGGTVTAVVDAHDGDVGAALVTELAAGADLLLVTGVASVDPLEATWQAVLEAGARPVRRGLPVHPGSSYWLADLGGCTVVGVASCGTFSRRTALDLLLARRFAGEPLDTDFLAGLGHGGLLVSELGYRFPPYEAGGSR